MKTLLNIFFDNRTIAWMLTLAQIQRLKLVTLLISILVVFFLVICDKLFIAFITSVVVIYATRGIPWKELDIYDNTNM